MKCSKEDNSIQDIKNKELNKENIREFNNEILKIEKYVKEQITPFADIPKAVFIGMTGCGKSCLLCSLSGQVLLIKGEGKIMHLEGKGVGIGLESFTTNPMFEQDLNKKNIFIDCPGFEDVKGYKQEILNAFSMDNIFKNFQGHENKFKIILVISQDEFYTNKGTKMVNSFLRLKEMFPIGDKLEKNIGLVITKGSIDYDGIDYIKELQEQIKNTQNPPEQLVRLCDFFLSNPDHVFAFPRPSFKDKGKQYDFTDHQRLMNFLEKNLLINPDHKITLSTEAKLRLKILREDHSKKLSNTINKLCDKINNQFAKESKSSEIQKWYDIIYKLLQSDIKKSKELNLFLQKNIQNSISYQKDIDDIAEYELFDEFIDRILYLKLNTSCLNEVIQAWCKHAVNQLHKSLIHAIDSEKTKEKMEIEKQLRIENEQKIEKLNKLIQQKEKENKDRERELMNEIKNQTASHQKNLEELHSLQVEFARLQQQSIERDKNVEQLTAQLEIERNKPPQVVERIIERGGGGGGFRCNIC